MDNRVENAIKFFTENAKSSDVITKTLKTISDDGKMQGGILKIAKQSKIEGIKIGKIKGGVAVGTVSLVPLILLIVKLYQQTVENKKTKKELEKEKEELITALYAAVEDDLKIDNTDNDEIELKKEKYDGTSWFTS